MGLLRLLFKSPIRIQMRILQASLEILKLRITYVEEKMSLEHFPNAATRQRLSESIGQHFTIHITNSLIHGTLLSVQADILEVQDDSGHLVMIPFSRVTALQF
jgi:hypothetical protein